MPKTTPFETHTDRYEEWFERYEDAYQSELNALGRLVPPDSVGVEIGVGTGRFAEPLGVGFGLDPALGMLQLASERDLSVVRGVAESLPFREDRFDTVVIVTTICFVDDIDRTLQEAHRILRQGGQCVIGYVDPESPIGQRYAEQHDENPFYEDATFVPTPKLLDHLNNAGFSEFESVQTIFEMPGRLSSPAPVRTGQGEGLFVALSARA
jgi:SAM-dependent methyltransferase